MDYQDKIATSPILFKIRTIAVNVFSSWKSDAKVYGNASDETFNDVNEDTIVQDFTECLSLAISAIKNEDEEDRKINGWSYGFICGFIKSNLNITWTSDYIIKKTEEYRDMMMLNATSKFFEVNPQSIKNVHAIYKYFQMKSYFEMQGKNPQEEEYAKCLDEITTDESNQFVKDFHDYFNNEFISILKIVHRIKTKNHCPNINVYFKQEEVERLLVDCGAMDEY